MVRVLKACGADVSYPELPDCCGLPAINSGDPDLARQSARLMIEALERADTRYIVSSSTSCVVTTVQDYPHLFRDDADWLPRAEQLAKRVIDFTGFMAKVARLPTGALRTDDSEIRFTYHDACQTNHVLGIRGEQRRLISQVMGLTLIEMDDAEMCCGFGGTFSFDHPEIAGRLTHRKLDHASRATADVIVTDNPGCIMQLRGGDSRAWRDHHRSPPGRARESILAGLATRRNLLFVFRRFSDEGFRYQESKRQHSGHPKSCHYRGGQVQSDKIGHRSDD